MRKRVIIGTAPEVARVSGTSVAVHGRGAGRVIAASLAAAGLCIARLTTAQDARPPAPVQADAPPGVHLGVPGGWIARYPCQQRLRPAAVRVPRGALTRAEACAATVAVYEAWIAAARSSTRPFTPAALADTGRVDGVLVSYLWDVLTGRTDYTVELHFGPGAVPVVGVVDAHAGVRRVYPGEPFLSRADYDRALHRRPARSRRPS